MEMTISGVPIIGEFTVDLTRDCKKHLADRDEL